MDVVMTSAAKVRVGTISRPVAAYQATTLFFPSLDILRGFAALSVVAIHIIELLPWTDFPVSNPFFLWLRIGWMGVDLFFVISGFVIFNSLLGQMKRNDGKVSWRDYWTRRFRRIAPLYALTSLVFIFFVKPEMMFEANAWFNYLTHVLFVHNLFLTTHGGINGPTWSIGTEMQFYLIAILVAPLLTTVRRFALAMALFMLTAWTWRYAAFNYVQIYQNGDSWQKFHWSTQVIGMLDEFALGMTIAFVLRRYGIAWAQSLLARAVFAAAGAFFFWFMWTTYWAHADYWSSVKMVTLCRTLFGLAMFGVVTNFILLNQIWFVRWTAPLRYLGTISYGIYLWHLPVLLSLKKIPFESKLNFSISTVGLTILCASLSWHFFEKRFLKENVA